MKQQIKYPLEYFNEGTDDDIIRIVMDLANKQSMLVAIPCTIFKQLLPSLNAILNYSLREGFLPNSYQNGYSHTCT